MISPSAVSASTSPKWLRDILRLLPIRSQFVLSGAIHDYVSYTHGGNHIIAPFCNALTDQLKTIGYRYVLKWDPIDRLKVLYSVGNIRDSELLSRLNANRNASLDELGTLVRALACTDKEELAGVAIVIDFASRISDESNVSEEAKRLFMKAEMASHEAVPIQVSAERVPLFNPVFWLTNRIRDLPYWLTADSSRIHSISVPEPGAAERQEVLGRLYGRLSNDTRIKDISQAKFAELGASLTHGMTLGAMVDVITLMQDNALPASAIDDAIQGYRIGDLTLENPWRTGLLKNKIQNGAEILHKRVKGQEKAVIKVLDVLKRTSVGLTGAHGKTAGNRPRGVLFFVGPTGVGKTEMAKSITELIFGNDSAYRRFDMSEFSSEHSADRLIGAPPGYVGFDQGGELTNAMRENPFRVLLFDEIDKANPAILLKFLQILEDGRLTDGRGETIYFSDSLIIFTSNQGVSRRNQSGVVEYLVTKDDEPEEFEEKIISGIREYFHLELGRPELLNRFGENFVVFQFIEKSVALDILAGMIENIKTRLMEEQKVRLEIADSVYTEIQRVTTSDLSNGGRGIGAKLEDCLVNPLSRALFDLDIAILAGKTCVVNSITQSNGIYELECTHKN